MEPGILSRLRRWDDAKGWTTEWMRPARHAFLEADLEVGTLYWLSDLTSGKEEQPFYIDDMGRQVFPHAWWPDNGLRQAVRAD